MIPDHMRAAVITRSGGPEVLEIREVPTPVPATGEVLVRVHGSALNRADLLQREGRYPAPSGAAQAIPGLEFAGEVVRRGMAVTRWREGARVFGVTGGGAHAEYVVAREDELAAVPSSLDWLQAGAVPEAFITAHDALVTQARMTSGDRVLIHAVGSGVGLAATEVARALGAMPYGTARTAEKIEKARDHGLIAGVHVQAEDHRAVLDACAVWSDRRGMDVILDLVGGPYVETDVAVAAPRARIMLVGTVAGRTATLPLGAMLGKRLHVIGTVLRGRAPAEKAAATAAFAADVLPLLERGVVAPVVDSVFPLECIRDAHERLASNATFGKVVIQVAD
jgi:putative PIG3 family NAD(P)H quinone oxidoreductase